MVFGHLSLRVCLLFRFLAGGVPYGEDLDDPQEIYKQITKNERTMPEYVRDKNAIKLIDQLLDKTPEKRLGGSYDNLK